MKLWKLLLFVTFFFSTDGIIGYNRYKSKGRKEKNGRNMQPGYEKHFPNSARAHRSATSSHVSLVAMTTLNNLTSITFGQWPVA